MRRRLKRIGQSAIAMFALLLLIVLARAGSFRSRQPVVPPLVDAPIDGAAIAAHLAAAITKRTVSQSAAQNAPPAELEALRGYLDETFPRTKEKLEREIVADHSLLYTWKGSSADPPIILCAHQDVVPIEPGTEDKWTKPPFSGAIEGGFVWGRGALDDKGSLIAIFEAVELLLAKGFVPKRTVYLAFGHNEEVLGTSGAGRIAALLASRGVHAEAVLDEGAPLVDGIVPSIAGPVAPIGIAEKGYLTVTLAIDLPGGHSSTPAPETALGVLAAAVDRLRTHPLPARLDGATGEFFLWAMPEMSFGQRMVLANTWLTWPLVSRTFARVPALDASVRTTTAVTVFRSGMKDNVVPRTAEAEVNFRVLPGDTTAGVIEHIRAVLDDPRVTITPNEGSRTEPTRVSSPDSRVFGALARTVREIHPAATVAPALFIGATDGRKYEGVATDVYRFVPVRIDKTDIARVHGTDERVTVANLVDATRFYRRILEVLAGS